MVDNSDIVLIYTSSPKKFCLGLGINILVQPDIDYFVVTLWVVAQKKKTGRTVGSQQKITLC